MEKVTNLVNHLFAKSNNKRKLETDASPVPQPRNTFGTATSPIPQQESTGITDLVPVNNSEFQLTSTENQSSNIINNTNNVFNFTNLTGFSLGPTTVFVNNKNEDNTTRKTNVLKITRTIEKMLQSTESISERMLDTISTHLGKEYKDLMRSLGMTQGQIEQVIMDFHINGTKEIIYQLLLDWTRREHETATLGKITQMLWKKNHRECVLKMKDTYKSESNSSENM